MRVGSITFFISLLLRAAGIKFSSDKIKECDDSMFNIQLFRLYNGVKVNSENDIVTLKKGLDIGCIKKETFLFSSFFGTI